jgi:hypothetical protein
MFRDKKDNRISFSALTYYYPKICEEILKESDKETRSVLKKGTGSKRRMETPEAEKIK